MTHRRRAFTLLELLVAVGLIALLASLVVVALGGVTDGANRAKSVNALRSLMTGHATYSSDHKQRFLPGYVSADTQRDVLGLRTKYSDSGAVVPEEVAESYVWRLAPYVDHNWKAMLVDFHSKAIVAEVTRDEIIDRALIASRPSFGINSIFVGGDDVNGPVARNPWYPADPSDVIAATRLSQVKNPARLLVFAPSNFQPTQSADADTEDGRPVVLPPDEWGEIQWSGGPRILGGDDTSGTPIARWGTLMPNARLDGSVIVTELGEIGEDMRTWSPWVTGGQDAQ